MPARRHKLLHSRHDGLALWPRQFTAAVYHGTGLADLRAWGVRRESFKRPTAAAAATANVQQDGPCRKQLRANLFSFDVVLWVILNSKCRKLRNYARNSNEASM